MRDLDRAYASFFAGRAHYPTPRRKGVNDSFRFQGREVETKRLNAKWSAVRLPKVGLVKFRDTRPMHGTLKNATVTLDALGWHISFVREIAHIVPVNICPSVGIDRGVANTLALSANVDYALDIPTGERMSVPRSLEAIERRHRAAQHIVARRKRGSVRRAKALRRAAKLSACRSRIRRDWAHKTALNLASRFGTVVLEDLRIKNMTTSAKGTIEKPGSMVRQKAALNRSILNQGWFSFQTILAYKLEERGGYLCKVDPAYTSQTCSECGAVDRQSRESQAVFVCRQCGFHIHPDTNAALNILRRNTASMRINKEGHKLSGVRTERSLKPPENPPASAGGRC